MLSLSSGLILRLQRELERARQKNPAYSLRAFARRLGVHPSALSEILNGKRQVTQRMARKLLQGIDASPDELGFLLSQVRVKRRTRSAVEAAKTTDSKNFVQFDLDRFHLVAEWFHFAIYSLAETADFRSDPIFVARRLGIQEREAKQALKRLERLGLLKEENGELRSTGVSIATPSDIADVALKRSHRQELELALRSLNEHSVHDRDITSISMATSPAKLVEAKKRIKEFRRSLCAFLEDLPSQEKTDVYQMNFQLFPLTRTAKKSQPLKKEKSV